MQLKLNGRRTEFFVAQIFNLLYRRFATCQALILSDHFRTLHVPPIANRRYSRMQSCATLEEISPCIPTTAKLYFHHQPGLDCVSETFSFVSFADLPPRRLCYQHRRNPASGTLGRLCQLNG